MMESKPTETEAIALAFVPTFSDDSKKATYLSYLVANFSHREACQLTPVSEKQVHRWRDADPNFAKIAGEGLRELRKEFASSFIDMQFTRNFHLILQKDFRVLYKDAIGGELTKTEDEYLGKIRQHYTPQSLAMVKQLLGGGTVEQPFDFTKLTLSIWREQIDIVQEKGNSPKGLDILGHTNE